MGVRLEETAGTLLHSCLSIPFITEIGMSQKQLNSRVSNPERGQGWSREPGNCRLLGEFWKAAKQDEFSKEQV